MSLKIIDHYDSRFTLDPQLKATLFEFLTTPAFLAQIAQAKGWNHAEFTELLFQPVPYSTSTPKGMPAEFEKFHTSLDHAIINIPPHIMFQAKVFKPSRLCAIYCQADAHQAAAEPS
jgi:hypothetical protein